MKHSMESLWKKVFPLPLFVPDWLWLPRKTDWCSRGSLLDYSPFPLDHSPTRWWPSSPVWGKPTVVLQGKLNLKALRCGWGLLGSLHFFFFVEVSKNIQEKIKEGLLSSQIWKRIPQNTQFVGGPQSVLNIAVKYWLVSFPQIQACIIISFVNS